MRHSFLQTKPVGFIRRITVVDHFEDKSSYMIYVSYMFYYPFQMGGSSPNEPLAAAAPDVTIPASEVSPIVLQDDLLANLPIDDN